MFGKKKVSESEARQALRDAKARRALLDFLWDNSQPENSKAPPLPRPMMDDKQVMEEIKRILGN